MKTVYHYYNYYCLYKLIPTERGSNHSFSSGTSLKYKETKDKLDLGLA